MHPKAHKTKWTLYYILTDVCLRFDSEEAAKIRAFECAAACPVRIIPPIYGEE
ncbi:MAG: hypothetical protein [Caudoviricetes sp.]|nr:MAG: hypothetical protein [Caudoviricetes sp.]